MLQTCGTWGGLCSLRPWSWLHLTLRAVWMDGLQLAGPAGYSAAEIPRCVGSQAGEHRQRNSSAGDRLRQSLQCGCWWAVPRAGEALWLCTSLQHWIWILLMFPLSRKVICVLPWPESVKVLHSSGMLRRTRWPGLSLRFLWQAGFLLSCCCYLWIIYMYYLLLLSCLEIS